MVWEGLPHRNTPISEIAKPRVLPKKPPSRPPKLAPADLSIVLCTPIHSGIRRGGLLGISKALGGEKEGVAIDENPGFPVSKPGVS